MNKKVIIPVTILTATLSAAFTFKSEDNALAYEKHSTIIEEELTTEAETESSSNTDTQPLSDIDTVSKY